MKKHLRYARYVLVHKWYVLTEGLKVGAPLWQLLIHDWSKFTPSEWRPYANHFYGVQSAETALAFRYAWLKHLHRNPHHYEYWITPSARGGVQAMAMPERYIREMLADWRSVGRTLKQNDPLGHAWYLANRSRMELHPNTTAFLEKLMGLPMDLRKAV